MKEIKRYIIDQSLSDDPEETTDSFFNDIAMCNYSEVKAVVETMQNKIKELEKIIQDSWNQQCPCAKIAKGIE